MFRFDVAIPAEATLFAELQHMMLVSMELKSAPAVKALLADDIPDAFALSVSSLTALVEEYGRDSVLSPSYTISVP